MRNFLLFIFTSAMIFSGCQRPENSRQSHEEVTQQAIDLLAEDKHNEAIELLQKELQQRPVDRTRVLLASAYAQRAGIQVKDYWGFVVGYENLIKNSTLFGTTTQEDDSTVLLKELIANLPEEARAKVKELNINFVEVQKIRKRLEQIPPIDEKPESDISQAVYILSPTKTAGARLYRAVLEVILLKSSIEKTAQFLQTAFRIKNTSSYCNENFNSATDGMESVYSLVIAILGDVEIAFPTQQAEILKIHSQADNSIGNLAKHSDKVRARLCVR